MIEDAMAFTAILLLAGHILIKYEEGKRAGEKLTVCMGGPFCFLAIILLLLDLILI